MGGLIDEEVKIASDVVAGGQAVLTLAKPQASLGSLNSSIFPKTLDSAS